LLQALSLTPLLHGQAVLFDLNFVTMLIKKDFFLCRKSYVLDVQLNSTGRFNGKRSAAVFLWSNVSGGTKMNETLFPVGAFD
jgi:hypothetical protein